MPQDDALRVLAEKVVQALKIIYPECHCALLWGGERGDLSPDEVDRNAWKLLVMARLSAQCTDARVNIVCKDLFASYPTLSDMAQASTHDIERIIRPCGLYHAKAQSIKASCEMLLSRFDGKVPSNMEDLLTLPGVGRKIANLLLGDIYHMPAVVTDTHCIRICGRLGFYPETLKDPLKIEKILSAVIDPQEQSDFCHRMVQFGRDVCDARRPRCDACPMREFCAHCSDKEKSQV